jgi:hypothetical protein
MRNLFILLLSLSIISCSSKLKREIKQINTINETFENSIGIWVYDSLRNKSVKTDIIEEIMIDSLYFTRDRDLDYSENMTYSKLGNSMNRRYNSGDFGFGRIIVSNDYITNRKFKDSYFDEYYFFKINDLNKIRFNITKEKEVKFYFRTTFEFYPNTLNLLNSDTCILNNQFYYYKKYLFSKNYGLNFFYELYKNSKDFIEVYDLNKCQVYKGNKNFNIDKIENCYLDPFYNSNLVQGSIIGTIKNDNENEINIFPEILQVRSEEDTINIVLPPEFSSKEGKYVDFKNTLKENELVYFKTVFIFGNQYLTELKLIRNDYK